MQSEKQYIDLYNETQGMIKQHSCDVLNKVRDKAFEDFKRQGFPTKKMERYKYTDISKLFAPDYGLNLQRLKMPINPYEEFKCDVPDLNTSLYFVVNDQFYTDQLPKPQLNDGIVVDSFLNALKTHSEIITKHYAKLADTAKDALTAFNTMLAQDGLFVYVPKDVKADRTIQVINILRSDVNLMLNRRILIVLEDGAELSMLFCDDSADDRKFLATQVIEAYVGNNAKLELNCLEETHLKNVRISNVYIDQQKNSRVSHNIITLHNGVTRNKLDLTFSGEGSECFLNGCVVADKHQHVDNNTVINHSVGNCTSNQLYKYVLDDHAVGAFAGLVYVAKMHRKHFRTK